MEDNLLNLDSSFWNNRYLNNEIGWDIGYISTPLKEYFEQITDKSISILIPGCGNAYEAEFLFNNGFKNVWLVDIAPQALSKFNQRVPNFPKEQLICEDFFNHKEKYDLVVEQTFFCAISPSLRSKYAKHVSNLLCKNGKVVGLLFDANLNDNKPPFGGDKNEYINYFTPYFHIDIMERAYNSIEPRKERELFIKLIKKDA